MKALIVDGNSILNRSFYGIKLLSTKKGQYTNAIYGFLTSFQKVKEEYSPDAIAIAFDLKIPTFRKKIFEGYKANRKGMPDELASQLPCLKEILLSMGYKLVECPGFEADDILGTLSYNFGKQGNECLIYTGDRDSLQLVSDFVSIRLASTKDYKFYDVLKIKEDYGVSPLELIEIKALQGDTSDNIPGVKGIGSKTAEFLIQKFKNLDNLYENINSDEIKETLRKKLIEGKESAYMSKKLGTINLEAPIETDINLYMPKEKNIKKLKSMMVDLEFFSLMNKFIDDIEKKSLKNYEIKENTSFTLTEVCDFSDMDAILQNISKIALSINSSKSFSDKNLYSVTVFYNKDDNKNIYYFKSMDSDRFKSFENILKEKNISKIVYNSKEIFSNLEKANITIDNISFDIILAAYILNPSASDYTLERLCEEYNVKIPKIDTDKLYEEEEINIFKNTVMIWDLENELFKELEKNDQLSLFSDVELPLSKILADMEIAGFKVDSKGLSDYSKILADRVSKIQTEIYEILGFEFNINSPKQLGTALFENLGLPKGKKGKTGYSTSAKVLESLRLYHPIIDLILEFRALSKLKSTFCDGMIKLIGDDGRIHAYFNQTETRTGRISCTDPNLQNIPIRMETGRELRKYFCAEPNYILVDADYSQIELRVLAHLSCDENMINAFINDEDIHSLTASKIFNLPPDMIGAEARTRAKAVNFGIIYGMGAFSLSQDLGITRAEADRYIKAYLFRYSGVNSYLNKMVENAKSKGYAETILKRRRYLPELVSSNYNLRSFGERVARNMPIQGSAADIIKLAMIKVYNRLLEKKLRGRLILQVHDELIVESHIDDAKEVENVLREEMENVIKLSVPLKVNISSGETWYNAKN